MTKKELLAQITGLLAGRVAEELFVGEITTGASNDFMRASKIARSMVTEWGMSDLGPVQLEHKSEGVFLGRDYNKSKNFSDAVALEIDKSVRKIIDGCYSQAEKILKANEDLITLLSTTLIDKETLTREEIIELVETGKLADNEDSEDRLKELRQQVKALGVRGFTKMTEEQLEAIIKDSKED